MAWTKEQDRAIHLEGTNIIVSAGAGSGKTAVLTERAKRKVLGGVHVNELLVLTFTNAAAAEMKDRIREAIKDTPGLEEELDYIDGAYITTFDAFSLAMVKKYHDRLNVSNSITITDDVLIDLNKKRILDEIFDEKYITQEKRFLKLIDDFCLKDDKELKEAILNLYRKIELKYNKTEFLKNYLNEFNQEKYNSFGREYEEFLRSKQSMIKDMISSLNEYFDGDFVGCVEDCLEKFLKARSYDEFYQAMDYGSVRVPRGSSEEGKALKSTIYDELKDIKNHYMIYSSYQELMDELESTLDDISEIIDILILLDQRLDQFKFKHDYYNFTDIARMAIQVVENNPEVRDELKNQFREIMIDEYQDTSDTQEKFISLISNHNVYMVGDIKQSIYRFRNANPYLFKEKYNTYRDTDLGEKIDLLHNFRSRDEVLKDINVLFDYVMDDDIGGAEYQESHRMVFGNESYNLEGKTNQNYHMDIITYNKDELGNITKSEEEAFIIGNDIINKVNSHFQVFDKKKKILRDCTYQDFVILLDKSRDFDLYKKVFEYLQIPLTVLKDESLRKDIDVSVFKNLLQFICLVKDQKFDKEFEYSFVSLSRSFLYRIDDKDIYEIILKKNYQDTKLYQDALELSLKVDCYNPSQFFREALEKVEYDSKILTIHNIHSYRVRCEFFYRLLCDYEKNGGTIRDFIQYLDQIFEEDYDLKFKVLGDTLNSCMIMTIHASKGLEYPVCYFAGLTSKFNLSELRERILFDNEYGIVLPKIDHYYKDTILKVLLKNRVRKEEVGEKIRLFYVAVTRAKEKMIFVMPEAEEEKEVFDIIPSYEREGYSSFYSIMKSIYSLLLPYIKKTDIKATKDYLLSTSKSEIQKSKDSLLVEEINIESNEIVEKHFSKSNLSLITKEEKEVMDFGTKVHEVLEEINFFDEKSILNIKNPMILKKVKSFIESDMIQKHKDCNMYKEFEFLYEEDSIMNHGIIDLLIEDKDQFIIIDYKLKNIDDDAYDLQLNGYRNYIIKRSGKKCSCFLYSIMDEEYREVL